VPHCDPEVLGLAALGERVAEADAAHLAGCARCRQDVAELAAVVGAVRVDVPAGPPVEPPARVWDAVAAATGVSAAPRAPAAGSGRDARSVRDAGRWAGRRVLLAVAAACLAVGAVGGALVTRLVGGDAPGPAASGPVVARVSLAALPLAADASGAASVVRSASARDLVVDVSRLGARPGTFYEVWLIDRSVQRMVPVGILRGSEGVFTIPDSVDLGQYPVVDISVQLPGDPRHSGRSVLRGTLPA